MSILGGLGSALLAAAGDVAVAGVKAIAKAIKGKLEHATEEPGVPLPHAAVDHIEAQIDAGARKFPSRPPPTPKPQP